MIVQARASQKVRVLSRAERADELPWTARTIRPQSNGRAGISRLASVRSQLRYPNQPAIQTVDRTGASSGPAWPGILGAPASPSGLPKGFQTNWAPAACSPIAIATVIAP